MGVNASNYPYPSCQTAGVKTQSSNAIGESPSHPQFGCQLDGKLCISGLGQDKREKKRSSNLALLKKKLFRRRKSAKSADHAKHMRELLCSWDVRDVGLLVKQYEAALAVKELAIQACVARPEASRLNEDLAKLYQFKYCTDVDLIFQGTCFPVHRAILAARCPFFKTLLLSNLDRAELVMDISTVGIDIPILSSLLHYLYSGEFGVRDSQIKNVDVLVRLSEEFGMPNALHFDIYSLLESCCYYDAVLSFTSSPEASDGFEGCRLEGDFRCHKAILCARSPFFRNLLQKRIRSGEETTDRTLQTPARIVLNEAIIPKKYAKVILHCMYTDLVDLDLVLPFSPSTGSLREVQDESGKDSETRLENAMELFHIALFIEFDMLAQGCEDLIVESVTLDSLVTILKWSSQPYGSKWVHRQMLHFLCEEFSNIVASDSLFELSKEHLMAAIQSDYLQASEHDILKAVIKWAEHQLAKRLSDEEPNLLNGTAHSVNKRGVKKRDLDSAQLREIVCDLVPHVRIAHVLPAKSEALSDAMKRALISSPPLDMLPPPEGRKSRAWFCLKASGIGARPRLFTPYIEEAKIVLDELMSEQSSLEKVRMSRISSVPDTLYMVDSSIADFSRFNSGSPQGCDESVSATLRDEVPVPPVDVAKSMFRRLREIWHSDQVQRAYALNIGAGAAVTQAVYLRVVREFGLPDATTELLKYPTVYFPNEHLSIDSPVFGKRQANSRRATPVKETNVQSLDPFRNFSPPLPPPPPPYHPPASPRREQTQASEKKEESQPTSCRALRANLQPHSAAQTLEQAVQASLRAANCEEPSDDHLDLKEQVSKSVVKELMPDIAMAATSKPSLPPKDPELCKAVSEAGQEPTELSTEAPELPCSSRGVSKYSLRKKKHSRGQKPRRHVDFWNYPDFYDFSPDDSCQSFAPSQKLPSPAPSPSKGHTFCQDAKNNSRQPTSLKPPHLSPALLSKRKETLNSDPIDVHEKADLTRTSVSVDPPPAVEVIHCTAGTDLTHGLPAHEERLLDVPQQFGRPDQQTPLEPADYKAFAGGTLIGTDLIHGLPAEESKPRPRLVSPVRCSFLPCEPLSSQLRRRNSPQTIVKSDNFSLPAPTCCDYLYRRGGSDTAVTTDLTSSLPASPGVGVPFISVIEDAAGRLAEASHLSPSNCCISHSVNTKRQPNKSEPRDFLYKKSAL
ncbi:BTB/POZ domain-containing protein 7-like [Hypanus sabinus]|uniref:BTB/POZ domain-containing protein 7-like n=1 Tax=Hypanus sabinus TaxID=79690 RepID=UPI0028C3CD7F|nr:BTB/POZ domain-containing protein 7-like [Hypanus sabinus]